MEQSILLFLPRMQRTDSGALQWPPNLSFALKALSSGPSVSHVRDSESLCDSIHDLLEQSGLCALPPAIFHGITTYFDELITRKEAQSFFEDVLPFIADLAFRLPALLNKHFNQPMEIASMMKKVKLRLLETQQAGIVLMSRELVAAILACAFFCLYPSESRYEARLPCFNFDGLFDRISKSPQQEQKIHCILHYFKRVREDMPEGMISFERKVLPRRPTSQALSPISEPDQSYWSTSSSSLCPIQVFDSGVIEDDYSDVLEIDFANRFLGGGVLGHGCVQEEIRFVISPELLAGLLFMPAMHVNEAIEIRGAERFSCYTGYASSFCFAGNYADSKPRDFHGRHETRIVAIDALVHPGNRQYEESLLLRETNKAFCGFLDHLESYLVGASRPVSDATEPAGSAPDKQTSDPSTVHYLPNASVDAVATSSSKCCIGIATGNWGCGAFGGDVELKSLLQWIAASQAGRPFLHYYTFGGPHGPRLQQVADWIINEKWVVGELWGLLVDYGNKRLNRVTREGLFQWILPQLSNPVNTQARKGLRKPLQLSPMLGHHDGVKGMIHR